MSLNISVKMTSDKVDNILKSLKKADNDSVEVGYFEEQGKHKGSGLLYSHLADIHEHGRTIRHPKGYIIVIPPRPFLKFGLGMLGSKLNSSRVVKRSFKAWADKLEKTGNIEPVLEAIGQLGVRQVRAIFGSTKFLAPNAKSTISRKGSNKPLIAKGELRSKVAYRTSISRKVKAKSR